MISQFCCGFGLHNGVQVVCYFCERRGWQRRQLANQLTRFCAAMIPACASCLGSCSVFGEKESVMYFFFKGRISEILAQVVGLEVMHVPLYWRKASEMANCR